MCYSLCVVHQITDTARKTRLEFLKHALRQVHTISASGNSAALRRAIEEVHHYLLSVREYLSPTERKDLIKAIAQRPSALPKAEEKNPIGRLPK